MALNNSIRSAQRRERRIPVGINADASTPTLLINTQAVTLTRNGVGDYTLTIAEPYRRAPFAVITGLEDNTIGRVGTRAVGSIQILIEDVSTNVAADLDVYVEVVGWDAEDEI